MSEQATFQELVRRVRAGDAQACTDLVRQYEPTLRTVVHVKLTDPTLRRVLDSVDICQSILANFFLRVASGQYELETPEQLLKLLATMARNQIIKHVYKQQAARRDHRRDLKYAPDEQVFVDRGPSPSSAVAHAEMLREFQRRLSVEERRLADERALGRSWNEIAAEVGGQPNALRMRLDRAVERVMNELGLVE